MVENRVCFTVRGEFGAQMSFESKNTIPYEALCKCVNKDTLEEYDEQFGDDEDG